MRRYNCVPGPSSVRRDRRNSDAGERTLHQIRPVVTLANTCSVTWKVMATARRPSTPAKGSSKRRARHAPAPRETVWSRHQRDIWIVLMILAGLLVLLAEIDALGPVGRGVNEGFKLAFGVGRVAIP